MYDLFFSLFLIRSILASKILTCEKVKNKQQQQQQKRSSTHFFRSQKRNCGSKGRGGVKNVFDPPPRTPYTLDQVHFLYVFIMYLLYVGNKYRFDKFKDK